MHDRYVTQAAWMTGSQADCGSDAAVCSAEPAGGRVDVFLSYNSHDRPSIERLARHLKRAGLEPWFDRWSLTPGGPWQEEITAGVHRASTCAVFVGPYDVGDWERLELAVAWIRAAADRTFRLFPVLLPGLDGFDPTRLPPLLATRTWVDLRPGLASARALRELTNAVRGLPFGSDVPKGGPDGPCPYRGLAPFEESDAPFYFGRENHVQRLIERLRQDRCVAVVGPSGSGKSSLVRAGVLPRLRAGALVDSDKWPIHVLRPGAHPLEALAAVLSGPELPAVRATADALLADERALHLAINGLQVDAPPTRRVLLVVDQAEELFTLCSDEAARRAFLANLHHATLVPGGRAAVVLTLRADFYTRLAQYPAVAQYFQTRQMLVGGLADDEIRQVIEEPARVAGLEVEAGLVETIRADVVREPGSLPLLQHALLETWRLRHGDMLTLAGYRDTGGVQRGLAERADAVYAELSAEGRAVARDLLLRLTQPGEGTEDTRRRISLAEVTGGRSAGLAEEVVGRFADQRLLTTSGDGAPKQTWVEISHEALIRGWPRLRKWIESDRNGLRIHRNLTEAAQEWERLGRDEGVLYRGGRLVEAQEWDDARTRWLNEQERRFLDASVAADRAARMVRRRRLRWTITALVAAVVTISAVAVVAVNRGQAAAQERDIAISRQLAANATTVLDVDPPLSLALALRAYTTAPTAQAEEILRHATAQNRGVGTLQVGGGAVYSARLFADDQTAATTAADGTVRIWNVRDQRLAASIPDGAGLVTSVRIRADGRQLASSAMDGSVALIDLPGRQRRVLLPATPDQYATSVDYSPDGRLLAASLSDGTVRILDTTSDRQTASLPVGTAPVFRVAFSPDGASVATAGRDGTAQVWSVSTARRTALLTGHRGPVLAVVFDAPDRQVVTAGSDGTVRVWDVTGTPVRTIAIDQQAVYAVAVSPDGNHLATAGEDGFVRLWDTDGVELAALPGHHGAVFDVGFDATGQRVISAGKDGTARVWDPVADEAIRLPATWAAYSPDGRRVVVGGTDGHIRVLAADHLTPQLDLGGHTGRSWPVFSADGTRIVSAGDDGAVVVWDASSGRQITELHPHRARVWSAVFDPTGTRVLSSADDGTIAISDVVGGATRQLPAQPGAVNIAVFSPDGGIVASVGAQGVIQLWSPGAAPRLLTGHEGPVRALAFAADGRLLASAGYDGTVRVWRPSDGAPIAVLRGHQGPATAVDFAPDGRLVSTGDDGTLRVWDIAAARLLVELRVHDGPATTVDVAPDGRTALTVSEEDGVVRQTVCEVCGPIGAVLDLARVRGARPLTAEEEQRYMS